MGYETKLYICYRTDYRGGKNRDCTSLIEIARIDLCKSAFQDTILDRELDTEKVCLLQNDDDIEKDNYGKQLFAVDPIRVLEFLKKHNKLNAYRRYNAAIPMLENIVIDFREEKICCVLFGH